jgi:hypothetical protein
MEGSREFKTVPATKTHRFRNRFPGNSKNKSRNKKRTVSEIDFFYRK